METDWAENRAKLPQDFIRGAARQARSTQVYSTSERDKFRTRLERAPDGNGTEIYISHRGMEEVYTTRAPATATRTRRVWQPRPPDPELEAEFLRRLMVRLGVAGASAPRSPPPRAAPPAARRARARSSDGTAALCR